jgi:hypothetical protein
MTPRPVVIAATIAEGRAHYGSDPTIPLNPVFVTHEHHLRGVTVDSIHYAPSAILHPRFAVIDTMARARLHAKELVTA